MPFVAPSTNQIYSGRHWSVRHKVKAECLSAMMGIESVIEPVAQRVRLIFKPVLGKGFRRRDLSNYSYTGKVIEDCLVKKGYLTDDNDQVVRELVWQAPEDQRQEHTGVWVEIEPYEPSA